MNKTRKLITVVALCCGCAVFPAHIALAQPRPQDAALITHRNTLSVVEHSSSSAPPRRMTPYRSWSNCEKWQVRILPSEVNRMRLHLGKDAHRDLLRRPIRDARFRWRPHLIQSLRADPSFA